MGCAPGREGGERARSGGRGLRDAVDERLTLSTLPLKKVGVSPSRQGRVVAVGRARRRQHGSCSIVVTRDKMPHRLGRLGRLLGFGAPRDILSLGQDALRGRRGLRARRGREGKGLWRRRDGGGGDVGERYGPEDSWPFRHRGRHLCNRVSGCGGFTSGQLEPLLRQGRTSHCIPHRRDPDCTSQCTSHCRFNLIRLAPVQRDDLARLRPRRGWGGRSLRRRWDPAISGGDIRSLGRRGSCGLALGSPARREQHVDEPSLASLRASSKSSAAVGR